MTDYDIVIDLARGDNEDEMLDEEILELQKESQIHRLGSTGAQKFLSE